MVLRTVRKPRTRRGGDDLNQHKPDVIPHTRQRPRPTKYDGGSNEKDKINYLSY